ncbi:phosphate acetyl/butyryl transferase [Haemophilus pittmaniae HK 85]|nr:phosphate acetyl/butyryl transferase [Haemophilus pittmaniae HK 85]
MRPIFNQAKESKQRIIIAEGEEVNALHATHEVILMGLAKPILIGRQSVVEEKIKKLGLRMQPGVDFELIDNENNPRYEECWKHYYQLTKRKGITEAIAKRVVRSNTTVLASTLVNLGYADGLICGLFGSYGKHLASITDIIGLKPGVKAAAALNSLVLPSGNVFLTDTHVNTDPNAEELTEITLMAAEEVRRFGLEPAVALLSHSNYGSSNALGASKMREVLQLVNERKPELMIDGEMRGDLAMNEAHRREIMPESPLKGSANLLVFPNLSAARISYSLLRGTTTAITVGPILMGMNKSAHILNPSASVRRIINMIAYAAVKAQEQ